MAEEFKNGDTVEIEGYGQGTVTGNKSMDNRIRVRLADGNTVGVDVKNLKKPGNRKVGEDVGFPGTPAVGPGDLNAGDPTYRVEQQPLKDQPLEDKTGAGRATPAELAGEDDRKKAFPGTQKPSGAQDKAMRGPRDR